MNTTDWQQPIRCPRCNSEGGYPFSVQSTTSNAVIVTVRCDTCRHEWTLQRETPSLAPRRNLAGAEDALE